MFHMGWFLGLGFGQYGWNQRWSGNVAYDAANPELFVDMAHSLERAGFDYMMLEDASLVTDVWKGSMEEPLRNGILRQDPMPLVPILGAATKHLGIIATIATTFYPPYLAARLFASLDNLLDGRVGINLVTASAHAAAQNYGYDKHIEHDLRYEMADEWVALVKALWDSWESDAVIADRAANVYVDHTKVHPVDFVGQFYKSRGPLSTMPGPQRHPVLCQAGGSPAGREFGAKNADTLIASLVENPGAENMKAYRDDMSRRMIAHGRKPSDGKVMFLVQPIMADSDREAREKADAMKAAAAANTDQILAGLSYFAGIDFSQFDLDEPLPDLSGRHNGHQSLIVDFQKQAEGRTLREALAERSQSVGSVELVGTPESVAVQMGEVMDYVGGDGYLIRTPVTRKNITEICDGLAPQLRKRGLIRSGYTYDTFRENLLEY